jgi:hypothetical protein
MVGNEGLDHDASRAVRTSGSSCDLREQLKGSFRGPEVRQVEADIRRDDSDELDTGKIMTLGDHLGPDHDVDLFILERAQNALGMTATRGDVAIESHRAGIRKEASHFFFEPLGPDAQECGFRIPAAVADFRHGPHEITVVTAKEVVRGVKDERDVAVVAAFRMSTLETEDAGREAAAVEKEDRLASLLERL